MDETKEILINQFNKLPKDVQDAILSVNLRSKMQFITKKNNLHIDQAEALENETVFVMLGLEHPANLVANIAKNLEVSEEKAAAIAGNINDEIFLKIRESLKKIFEERKEEGEEKKGIFLGGSLSADEAGLSDKKDEGTAEKEGTLKREDILRDIEDKEHHNLPAINKTELHLEARPPSEIVEKTVNLPGEQVSFQNAENNAKIARQGEIKTQTQQMQKPPVVPQAEAIKTMKNDIFMNKMSGTVNLPKETIEINDFLPKLTKKPASDSGKKIDPYREMME